MIKRCVNTVVLIGLSIFGWSQTTQKVELPQSKKIDSLKQELTMTTDDSSRVSIMGNIGFQYEFLNLDSSLKYTKEGFALAKKRGFVREEAALMADLGSILRQQGMLAESLDTLLTSLKIAGTNNLPYQAARTYRRLADIYLDLEIYPKAIEYLFQARKIDVKYENKRSAAIDNVTLGHAYERLNKLDSASFYADMAFEQSATIDYGRQYFYQILGSIQLKKGNFEKGAFLLQEALMHSQNNKDFLTASDICALISEQFIAVNKKDSAILYASRGFEYGQQVSFKKGIMLCAKLLSELYDSTHPQIALKYLKISAAAKDSLFGVDNIQTIQSLVAREEAKQKELEAAQLSYRNQLKVYGLLAGLSALLVIAFILYRSMKQKQNANLALRSQKEKVEHTLADLKSTQAQLIQSEKMASLGELTAGIAHEIQNPLNFVNNFSEVNSDLINELVDEVGKGNIDEIKLIATDIKENSEKISHHGKRADAIVKNMLQHSRSTSNTKEPTDLNALADEYLRLAYHGLRAKDNAFNVTMKTEYDESLGKINIIPQDIGRVVLNVITNAFYAVNDKAKQNLNGYEPTVTLSTKKTAGSVEIKVTDNGNGISQSIVDKIFQPFFTTKPTGQGTGLGLSLSYDIIKSHGGEIRVRTKEGEGSEFAIQLPA